MKKILKKKKAFTLIELLVVIAIIALLTVIVLVNLGGAREKAKIAHVLEQIHQVRLAIELYGADTGKYPTVPCMCDCTKAGDPFSNNSLNVPGWDGPYLSLWDLAHPWHGHIGYDPSGIGGRLDWDDDGVLDCAAIFLDDDRPGTASDDNQGLIPDSALLRIDQLLDDGNLDTGNVRGRNL